MVPGAAAGRRRPTPARQPFGRPAARSMSASRQLAGRKSAPAPRQSAESPPAAARQRPRDAPTGPDRCSDPASTRLNRPAPACAAGIAPRTGLDTALGAVTRVSHGHRQPDRPCSALPMPITNPPHGAIAPHRQPLSARHGSLMGGSAPAGRLTARPAGLDDGLMTPCAGVSPTPRDPRTPRPHPR